MRLLEQLIEWARSAVAEIGVFRCVLIGVAAMLAALALLRFASLCVEFLHRRWLVRILHPGSFPYGSMRQELAGAWLAWLDRIVGGDAAPVNRVSSPLRTYELVAVLKSGDLCDVHYGLSGDQAYLLKTARVVGCDKLLAKECLILRQLHQESRGDLYGQYFPTPTDSFRSGSRSVSVFEWRAGYLSSTEIRQCHPNGIDGRHIAWMFNRTLEALGFVHRLGWVHGAVLPPHLLFHTADHGLQLVGWIHAERRKSPLRVVPRGFKAWYPPECHRREAATPATDMYLAAKSMIWLAGGNPLTESMPSHVPFELRSMLLDCLADSPSRRPRDAWLLHEQFKELLEVIYGPPQFCHLNMSQQ